MRGQNQRSSITDMANLNIHPAPGLGDLMAGYYVVPQNPLQMAQEGVSVVPKLGDFVAASFVVPQNPLYAQITGTVAPIGQGIAGRKITMSKSGGGGLSGCGDGCGCGGSCGCGDHGGMGDITADFTKFTGDISGGNYSTAISDPILGIPMFAWLAAGVAIMMMNKGKR